MCLTISAVLAAARQADVSGFNQFAHGLDIYEGSSYEGSDTTGYLEEGRSRRLGES